MKKTIAGKRPRTFLCLLALAASLPLAGRADDTVASSGEGDKDVKDTKTTTTAVAPAPELPFMTGNLTVNYETHFISNGFDVWGIGTSWDHWLVHPSLELDFNISKDLQFYVNTWWDVNDMGTTTIGKYIQEVDVNVGFYYTWDKLKFQLGYGAWNYASQTESVIDFRATYTDPYNLSPFVALHGRIGEGSNLGVDNGLLVQAGVAPSKTWGALTLSLPVTVDFDTTHNYAYGSSGFGFVSVGLNASYAIDKHLSLNLGATYYHTQHAVFPTNPKDDFVTGLAGFTIAF